MYKSNVTDGYAELEMTDRRTKIIRRIAALLQQ